MGKSTLVRDIVAKENPAGTVNLDEQTPRQAALEDPEGFIAALTKPVLIDEIQRGGPELVLAIKRSLEEDRTPGSFLQTGSANILSSKKVQEALTGRVERVQRCFESVLSSLETISSAFSSSRLGKAYD